MPRRRRCADARRVRRRQEAAAGCTDARGREQIESHAAHDTISMRAITPPRQLPLFKRFGDTATKLGIASLPRGHRRATWPSR